MADDFLARLDTGVVSTPHAAPRRREPVAAVIAPAAAGRETLRGRWPWLVIFLGVQFLWGAILFLPESQAYRPIVRALPYAASLGLLALYMTRSMHARAPGGTLPLVTALALLGLNLLHPTSQLKAGIAQCVFQLCIAAPMFWAWKGVSSPGQLRRLLWVVFWLNAIGALFGVLQVYFPDRFMPPQFSTLGIALNELYVESLTYVGADGTRIIRPPGLTDQPGGAAVAGALTVILAGSLSLTGGGPQVTLLTAGAAVIGLAAIYLTQVRSLLLVALGALGVVALVLFRRGQLRSATRIAVTAAVLAIAAFLWVRSVAGDAVEQRYVRITEEGAMQVYRENRGGFVAQTFGEMLDLYPFGAGVGRWGMMNVYFGDPTNLQAPPIHVEIQITGWLLDGGLPMWGLYGGAVLLALWSTYRHARQRRSRELADVALIVLGLQVLIVGFSWAGPAFNTQLGLLFWFFTSALHGASTHNPQSDSAGEASQP